MNKSICLGCLSFVLVAFSQAAICLDQADAAEKSSASGSDQEVATKSESTMEHPADAKLSADSANASVELSVPPFDHREYPEDRPGWLTAEPDTESETHRLVVVTEPCDSEAESKDRLVIGMTAALDGYLAEQFRMVNAERLLSIHEKKTLEQLVKRRYQGTLTAGGQTMHEAAAELQITPALRASVRQAWEKSVVRRRLKALGGLVAGGLVVLLMGSAVAGGISRRVQQREADAVPHNS